MFGNFGNTSTFGAGAFSTPTSNASVFGQPQQQPAASTSLFGGGFSQAKPTFGSSFGAPPNQNSMFGQQNRLPVPSTGSIFSGPTATVSPFSATSQAQVAGTSVAFNAITGNDTMMKNGVASPISTRHQCITCMKEYENKSLEELRLEDYQLNRKGPTQNSLFGATQPQQQQNTGLFSTIGATAAPTAFGQPNTFGATNTAAGGLFGSLNQPKPATSFFSNPATSTSAFGATSSGFAFNSPASQQPSVFGSNNNPVSTAGGLGAASAFSFGQPQTQQAQSGGLFGQKTLSTTATTGFGAFGAPTMTNSTPANKPVGFGFGNAPSTFGAPATPAFGTGTGSLFGAQPQQQQQQQQQQQNKPFSFNTTPFSAQTLPTQSSFGSTGNTAFTFTTTTSTPSLNFGSGSNTTFGGIGTTGNFGSTPLTFSSGGGQPSTGFGSSLGGFNTGTSQGFGNYAAPTNFNQTMLQQQTVTSPAGAAFATTPYKDSPLFYNLISNRKLEDMVKPTSPAAQRAIKEASRRRTSASVSLLSTSPTKNASFTIAKSSSFNKQSIFDGFDEEDRGISIDILSPKTSVKKLTLKNFRNTSLPSHRNSISFSPSSRLKIGSDNGLNDTNNSDFESSRASDIGGSNGEKQNSRNSTGSRNRSSEDISTSNFESDNTHIQGSSAQKRFSNSLERSVLNGEKEKRGCGVINTRGGYYVHPSIEDLNKLVDETGNCFVKGLVIGRQNHGEIRFVDIVNIAGINLDEIVYFRHKEVVVYPDDTEKPPHGEGLNCPAEIRLERVWPIDKVTKDPIKSPAKLKSMGYEETLRRSCNRLGAEFVSYNGEFGVWTFVVRHFSKYSCEPEESEDGAKAEATALSQKGLGGISMQTLQNNFPQKPAEEANLRHEVENLHLDLSKRWDSASQEMEVPESMPVFRRLIHSQAHSSTPRVHVSSEGEDSDLGYGDIEHNPLTPSESNDSELDWQLASGRSFSTDNEPIQRKKIGDTVFAETMKAIMLSGQSYGDTGDYFEPPIKRFRPPIFLTSETRNMSDSPVNFTFQKKKSEKSSRHAKSRATGPSLVAIQESEEQRKNIVPGYLASINKKSEIQFLPIKEDLFIRLTSAQSNGCKIKTVSRVCFGPRGYCIRAPSSGSDQKRRINFERINAYRIMAIQTMPYSYYGDAVAEQMKVELEESERFIANHIVALETVRETVESGMVKRRLNREIMMWELCEILWPMKETNEMVLLDSRGFVVKQRRELSDWFKKYSLYLFRDDLRHSDYKGSILQLLMLGRKSEACEVAMKSKNYTLARLMANGIENDEMITLYGQLDVLGQNDALQFIKPDIENILRLCAGEHILTEFSIVPPYAWLQHFALHLWHCYPNYRSVSNSVQSFLGMLEPSDMNYPHYLGGYSIPNLCIQLLKLYSIPGYPLKKVLDPLVYGVEPLDHKLSWLLMVNLTRFGYVCDQELYGSITTKWAGQLEQIGLWKWATFVMRRLRYTTARDCLTQRILERSIGYGGIDGYETFLKEKLFFSSATILAVKKLRASLQHRISNSPNGYVLSAKTYEKACEEFLIRKSFDTVV